MLSVGEGTGLLNTVYISQASRVVRVDLFSLSSSFVVKEMRRGFIRIHTQRLKSSYVSWITQASTAKESCFSILGHTQKGGRGCRAAGTEM